MAGASALPATQIEATTQTKAEGPANRGAAALTVGRQAGRQAGVRRGARGWGMPHLVKEVSHVHKGPGNKGAGGGGVQSHARVGEGCSRNCRAGLGYRGGECGVSTAGPRHLTWCILWPAAPVCTRAPGPEAGPREAGKEAGRRVRCRAAWWQSKPSGGPVRSCHAWVWWHSSLPGLEAHAAPRRMLLGSTCCEARVHKPQLACSTPASRHGNDSRGSPIAQTPHPARARSPPAAFAPPRPTCSAAAATEARAARWCTPISGPPKEG